MNLIVADPTLVDFSGHSFEYSRSLWESAAKLGCRCTTLARHCVSDQVVRQISAIPCFSYPVGHAFALPAWMRSLASQFNWGWQPLWNQFVHARMMLQDLRGAEAQVDLNPETIVIVPTTLENQIIPFVLWAERLPHDKRPRFAMVFHSSAYPEFTHSNRLEQTYRKAFRRLERSRVCQNFHLFTDTEELVEEFQGYTRLPVHLAPIPHAGGTPTGRPAATSRREARDPLRVTYLGYSNGLNKGFASFAPLFNRLRPYFESGRIVAEVQGNISHRGWLHVEASLRRLRDMPHVTLHEEPMSSDDYYACLRRADVVVLPYTTETYHSQTSGVFAEAVAHGKPVVVPRGTWMSRQLSRHAAGTTFNPKDLQSLHDAVVEAVDRHPELSERATRRASRWREQHSVPAYLDAIFRAMGANC